MSMCRLKKGDDVIVIAGKDKGKRGTVLRVMRNERVVVEAANMVKRHTRPNPQRGVAGGIIEKEAPIQSSNVMLYNPQKKAGDRVGFKTLEDGITRCGDQAALKLQRAEMLMTIGQHAEAVVAFQEIVLEDPSAAEAWRALVRALQHQAKQAESAIAAGPLVVLALEGACK